MKHNELIHLILYVIQGALIGIGAILPGVSGGVLCVAFGIYEPLMELFTHPMSSLKKNYKMFIPFGIGWFLGFVLLAKAMELLFSASAGIALMLFCGLICGTLPELFKKSEKSNPSSSWTPFIVSLVLAYFFFHLIENGTSIAIPASFLSFLFCGFLWGLSLIIPGFSSSSILIYLGLYEPMAAGIGSLDFSVLIPMFLGIIVTALLFARLVNMLFQKHYAVTSRIVLGFVIASSLKIIPASFGNPITLSVSLLCFFIGFAVSRSMDLPKHRQKSNHNKKGI